MLQQYMFRLNAYSELSFCGCGTSLVRRQHKVKNLAYFLRVFALKNPYDSVVVMVILPSYFSLLRFYDPNYCRNAPLCLASTGLHALAL